MVATLSAISSKDEAAMAQENSTAVQIGNSLGVDNVCVSDFLVLGVLVLE